MKALIFEDLLQFGPFQKHVITSGIAYSGLKSWPRGNPCRTSKACNIFHGRNFSFSFPLLLLSRAACMYISLYQVLSTKYAPLFIALTKPHYAIPTRPSCCIRHCRICFAWERKTTRLEIASNDRMGMALFFTQFTSSWRTTEWWISWIPTIFSPITYFSQTPEPSVVKWFLLPFVLYHLDVSTCCHTSNLNSS